jgi:hypothetical protein
MHDLDRCDSTRSRAKRAGAARLDRLDTCELCHTQAVIRMITANGGYLEWCAGHYTRLAAALVASGAVIVTDLRPQR